MPYPEFWVLDEDFYTLDGPHNHFQNAVNSKDAVQATHVAILMTVARWENTNGTQET